MLLWQLANGNSRERERERERDVLENTSWPRITAIEPAGSLDSYVPVALVQDASMFRCKTKQLPEEFYWAISD